MIIGKNTVGTFRADGVLVTVDKQPAAARTSKRKILYRVRAEGPASIRFASTYAFQTKLGAVQFARIVCATLVAANSRQRLDEVSLEEMMTTLSNISKVAGS